METLGFIGLGIMGEALCSRLIAAGYALMAYDIDPEKTAAAASRGAMEAVSIAEIARSCRTIFLMVPASEHVESVIREVLPVLAEDSLIIDMSTISPEVSIRLADEVRRRGSRMIDAPVVKSRAAAEAGELGILVGGDSSSYGRALPLLRHLGKEIIRMGPSGSGLSMKLCHNMLVAEIQQGVNEMLLLADRCGLDFDDVVRAVRAGGGQNLFLDSKAEFLRMRDFTPRFPFEHMRKDLGLARELAEAKGLALEGARSAQAVFERGMKEGYARKDYAAAIEVAERMYGK